MKKGILSNGVEVEIIKDMGRKSIVRTTGRKIPVEELDLIDTEDDDYYSIGNEYLLNNSDIYESVFETKKIKEMQLEIDKKKSEIENLNKELEDIRKFKKEMETNEQLRMFVSGRIEKYYIDGKDIKEVDKEHELSISHEGKLILLKKRDRNGQYVRSGDRNNFMGKLYNTKEEAKEHLEKKELLEKKENIDTYIRLLKEIKVGGYLRESRRHKSKLLIQLIRDGLADKSQREEVQKEIARLTLEEDALFERIKRDREEII